MQRARLVRRVLGSVVGILLLACAGWGVWAVANIRSLSVRTQAPFRADKAALRRLDSARGEFSLLVLRSSSGSATATVAVLRQPDSSSGTWAIALPMASIRSSDASGDTLPGLLGQGRASLLKAIEGLLGLKMGHYIEVDASRLFSVAAGWQSAGGASKAFVALSRGRPQSPSATLGALADAAERYRSLRSGNLGSLRAASLASSLAGAVVGDMGATQLDTFLRRIGADSAAGTLRSVVVPLEVATDGPAVISTSAGRALGSQMGAGKPFSVASTAVARIAPGSVTVTVFNGAGRDGVAGQAARILRRRGYLIKSTDVTNANQFVYDQTLVVYKRERAAAESVARSLPVGRVVPSRGMYLFATDVLVVVGKDWP